MVLGSLPVYTRCHWQVNSGVNGSESIIIVPGAPKIEAGRVKSLKLSITADSSFILLLSLSYSSNLTIAYTFS